MQNRFGKLYVLGIALLLMLPFIVVAGVSFNEKKRLYFPPRGFTLDWYKDVLSNSEWLGPIGTSLTVAAIATFVAVCIALPISFMMWRHGVLFAKALFGLGLVPFMLPPVTSALGFLIFWSEIGGYGSFWATTISHSVFLVTIPLMMISLGLETIDEAYLDAASSLGASEAEIFRTVILPLILPFVFGASAFCFVLSMNEYIIAFMVAGFTVETLPIKVVNSLRYGYSPAMAAVSVFVVLAAAGLFLTVARFGDLLRMVGALDKPD
ncbi:ABC transporter permease [Ruegeria atlantica]|uniref:ABC transporter permease n=1 Tax=Ruegeria atlantica TaxID=81569 RepID=UPI0014802BB0|nr:ABC transporter permease [Ruegeria atlantica]